MTIKSFIEEKVKNIFKKYALSAVIYAEEYLGSGKGQEKKEVAINYLINLLPIYLKPFTKVFQESLEIITGILVEKAVIQLHKFQETGGEI